MPYVTWNIRPYMRDLSIEDVLMNPNPDSLCGATCSSTHTEFFEQINPRLMQKYETSAAFFAIRNFNKKYADLMREVDKHYFEFKIPKRGSNKLRTINNPDDKLREMFLEMKQILEKKCYIQHHAAAYAYVKGRRCKDAIEYHQRNVSHWILKLDFHGFFPNTTQEFMINQLLQCFPFCAIANYRNGNETGFEELKKFFGCCFLNGGLPQGSPVSPMLTNAMMIPFDFALGKYCKEHKPYLVYTRYADDLLITSRCEFDKNEVESAVIKILSDIGATFELNKDKTRYCSRAGKNFCLGVMWNKDNKITIGHNKKNVFKCILNNVENTLLNKKPYSVEDAYYVMGLYSYYVSIEPEWCEEIVKKYSTRINIMEELKNIIKNK